MPDSDNNPSNGVESAAIEQPRSLRDVAEAAWDEVVEDAPDDDDSSGEVDDSGQPRDEYGRFRSKEQDPGEAAAQRPPSPEQDSAPQQPESPTQPPQGVSSEAPANWSAQDRQTFSALPPPAQDFLLRRHSEMEGEFQRRVQAAGGAVQFAQAVAPVFQDPVISGSLQQSGMAPLDAIGQWASFHRRAMDPDIRVRHQLLGELADRMGLVDPAANGQGRPPGPQLSEQDLKDPTIRYFADTLGRALSETQNLRGEIQRIHAKSAEQQQAEQLKATRWQVDSFADERDAAGNRLRPDFDEALPALTEMYRLNPQLDIRQAYEEARWRTPSIRARLIAQQTNGLQQRQATERARQAARSNVRGVTTRVSSSHANGEGPKGLRAVLEDSADEVGF